jgi:hypothetical protein
MVENNPSLKFHITINKRRFSNHAFVQSELTRLLSIACSGNPLSKKSNQLISFSYNIGDYSSIGSKVLTDEKNWLDKCEHADSFFIIIQDNVVLIDSKSDFGILHACYSFLETIGFIFLYPGKNFEFYNDSVVLDKKRVVIKRTPVFKKRGILLNSNLRNLINWIDFAPKIGINTIAIDYFNKKVKAQALQESELRGITFEFRVHTLGEDFCTHKEESYLNSEKQLFKYLEYTGSKEKNVYCFQKLGNLSKCSCTRLEKLTSFSNQLMIRLNYLIQNPLLPKNITIHYYARSNAWKIPKVLPHPDVGLVMSPSHRCYNHPLNSEICKYNKLFVYPQILKFIEMFKGDGISRNIEFCDLWLDSNFFSKHEYGFLGLKIREGSGRLPITIRTIQKDIQFYASLNIDSYILSAKNLDSYYFNRLFSPQINLLSKLLWNVPDIEPYMNNLTKFFFGEPNYKVLFSINEMFDPKHFIVSSFVGYKKIIKTRKERIDNLLKNNPTAIQKRFLKLYQKEMDFLLALKVRTPIIYLVAWFRLVSAKFKILKS